MLRNKKRWLLSLAIAAMVSAPISAAQFRTNPSPIARHACFLHDMEWESTLVARPPILESPTALPASGEDESRFEERFAPECFVSKLDATPKMDSSYGSHDSDYIYDDTIPSDSMNSASSETTAFGVSNIEDNRFDEQMEGVVGSKDLCQAYIPMKAEKVQSSDEGFPPAPAFQSKEVDSSFSECTPVHTKAQSYALGEEYLPYDMCPTGNRWMGANENSIGDKFVSASETNLTVMGSSDETIMDPMMDPPIDVGCFGGPSSCPYESQTAASSSYAMSNMIDSKYDYSTIETCPSETSGFESVQMASKPIFQAESAFSEAILGGSVDLRLDTESIVESQKMLDDSEETQNFCDPHANIYPSSNGSNIAIPVTMDLETQKQDRDMHMVSVPKSQPSMLTSLRKFGMKNASSGLFKIGSMLIDMAKAMSDSDSIE